MRKNINRLMLVLLATMLPTAWAFADWKVTIAAMENGIVVASDKTAQAGQTVTLTVKPDEYCHLKAGSLLVEEVTPEDSDRPKLAPRRTPAIGKFISLTEIGTESYSFVMPDNDVIVSALFYEEGGLYVDVDTEGEGTGEGDKITLEVEPDYDTFTATINMVSQNGSMAPAKVRLPMTVTDAGGNVFQVTTIAAYAFYGQTNITDIYLPDTDIPLNIEDKAFLLDYATGTSHHIPTIHTPFNLLDDYALMDGMSENYTASKMKATVTALHRYNTLASAVDIKVPEDISVYTAHGNSNAQVELESLGNGIVIKANNGVLLESPIDGSHSYEVTAIPTSERPSGMTPPTDNAQSYPNNQLVPVIAEHHFYAERNYHVLRNNQFFPISVEDTDKCCPAGKAILRLPY